MQPVTLIEPRKIKAKQKPPATMTTMCARCGKLHIGTPSTGREWFASHSCEDD